MPSMMLPATSPDAGQVVALIALCGAIFTLIEYNSHYPSLVEFREAPPFNRIRFLALFAAVFALSVIARGDTDPSTLTRLFSQIGASVGGAIDFPYSPVRLVLLILPEDADAGLVADLRVAAGLSYLCSIVALAGFVAMIRFGRWPARGRSFNVWVNLPTFDPTAGGDVVRRLTRDAYVNLVLGFLLPFMIPAIVKIASDRLDPVSLADPHTLIWTVTAWAFLPASLLMRGIALNRVAELIAQERRRAVDLARSGVVSA